jgi:chemotaxis protein CheC
VDDVRELNALQHDALREVANIGAGHAATALALMTDRRVMISVPRSTITPLEDVPALLGDPQDVVAAVLMHVHGDLTGRLMVLFPWADAKLLCDLLLHQPAGTTQEFGVLEQSGLSEVGNIVGSAYLTALAEFMGMMLLPSAPGFAIDYCGAVLSTTHLGFGQDRDFVFCVETDFHFQDPDRTLRGQVLLLPDLAALQAILDAIRLT